MTIFLVLWTVIGFLLSCYLSSKEVISSDMNFNQALFVSIVCGPITIAALLFGFIAGVVSLICRTLGD